MRWSSGLFLCLFLPRAWLAKLRGSKGMQKVAFNLRCYLPFHAFPCEEDSSVPLPTKVSLWISPIELGGSLWYGSCWMLIQVFLQRVWQFQVYEIWGLPTYAYSLNGSLWYTSHVQRSNHTPLIHVGLGAHMYVRGCGCQCSVYVALLIP